jgi:glycosyltransferase involved in cell wall biosynthesis
MRVAAILRVRDERPLIPWTLANLTFADDVFVFDNGSTDGTVAYLKRVAKAGPRVHFTAWDGKAEHFFREADQYRFAFDRVPRDYDWYYYLDADEIPNTQLRVGLRSHLELLSDPGPTKVCLRTRFLYLAPGWTEYYDEPSRYPAHRIWNYVPGVDVDGRGDPVLELPDVFLNAPQQMTILHLNWAMAKRFERKRKLYERRFGEVSWHPDEKYTEKTKLPLLTAWLNPEGKQITPRRMATETDL